jgi:hypothetical protein
MRAKSEIDATLKTSCKNRASATPAPPNSSIQSVKSSKKSKKASKSRPLRTKGQRKRQKSTPAPQPGTKAFRDLQANWYKKLKREGFKDLEKPNPTTGEIEPGHWLRGASLRYIANQYSETQARYYARLRNFLTHRPDWTSNKYAKLVAQMYTEGESYQTIAIAAHKARLLDRVSKWRVYKTVHQFVPIALKWNKSDPEGLDYPSDF